MLRQMIIGAVLLGCFATVGTSLVAVTYMGTAERIARNERDAMLEKLNTLVPKARYDNDIFHDVIHVTAPEQLGTKEPVAVYRARKTNEPVAAIIGSEAPEGYGGSIKLLVAINVDGSLAGVRVVSHKETPGLGDKIEVERDDWITHFDGHSLSNPEPAQWKVKKDGGIFDQFTGATITPRAVVDGVYRTLTYFDAHQNELFEQSSVTKEAAHE